LSHRIAPRCINPIADSRFPFPDIVPMLTRDERRAVLFLGAVAALGGLLRVVRSGAAAPGESLVAPEIAGEDLVRQAALARRAQELARPLRAGERVDVDRASPEEIERLPGIGPELARRIVADREAHGPFGSLEVLARVHGVGPGALRLLRDVASFSGVATPVAPGSPAPALSATSAPAALPPAAACPSPPLPLNRATAAELACLPGLGPVLASRIVADRDSRGPFREVKDLERVPGFGARRVARLVAYLRAP
jgi:competence protein ComEA